MPAIEKQSNKTKAVTAKPAVKRPGKRGGLRPGAGRPAGVPNKLNRSLKEKAAEHADAVLAVLVDVATDVAQPASSRVQAASAVLDRAFGKPSQAVEVELSTPFSQQERDALESELRAGYETLKLSGFWLKQKAEMQERKRLLNEENP